MKVGAVLIAAGTHTYPMYPSGEITVALRMIASLQKAGVDMIAVITSPEDQKMEKHLAQYGVFFLQNPEPENQEKSIHMGMNYLAEKCELIFLLSADRPLLDPATIILLKNSRETLAVPTFNGKRGQPLMIQASHIETLPNIRNLADMMTLPGLVEIPVRDLGILLNAEESEDQIELTNAHERKLSRLVPNFSINRGKPLVDRKLVVLLRLIRETQSVRDACIRMQISYSTAWNLLNSVEDSLGYPLILRNKGGPSGAGSLLTVKGADLLNACDQFEEEARKYLDQLYDKYLDRVL
jgi:molybdate transport repressor ModE-like protein